MVNRQAKRYKFIFPINRLSDNMTPNKIPQVYCMLGESNSISIVWLKITITSFLPKVIKVRKLSMHLIYSIRLLEDL